MGTLKPDTTYIYEHANGVTYAREFGAAPNTRFIIGCDGNSEYYKTVARKYFLEVEWAEIVREAETNKALQEAIERVKLIYHLSKKDGKE